jgi:WD40 repeat protein
LTPDEFRPGSRNKKIISIALNSKGILCAGTSVGDIIMWKIDFEGFKKQSGKIYQNLGNITIYDNFIGHFKKHTKLVHFCEFSPNGKLLITGSIDGSAKIWNLEQEKVKKGD